MSIFVRSVRTQSYVTKPIGGLTGLFVFLTTPKTTNPATRPWVSVRPWPTWSHTHILRSAAWARWCSLNLLHDWFQRAEQRVAIQNCVRLVIAIIRFLMSQHVATAVVVRMRSSERWKCAFHIAQFPAVPSVNLMKTKSLQTHTNN
jgi:hypothetical protein